MTIFFFFVRIFSVTGQYFFFFFVRFLNFFFNENTFWKKNCVICLLKKYPIIFDNTYHISYSAAWLPRAKETAARRKRRLGDSWRWSHRFPRTWGRWPGPWVGSWRRVAGIRSGCDCRSTGTGRSAALLTRGDGGVRALWKGLTRFPTHLTLKYRPPYGLQCPPLVRLQSIPLWEGSPTAVDLPPASARGSRSPPRRHPVPGGHSSPFSRFHFSGIGFGFQWCYF